MWRYGSDELETLSTYEDKSVYTPQAVTEHWVYAERSSAVGTFEGFFYTSREAFMNGRPDWKPVPGSEPEQKEDAQDTESVFVSKFADYPEDYFVKWAVWGGENGVKVSARTLEAINEKLEADGYNFGLKLLYVEDTGNVADLAACGADIASTGRVYEGKHAARDMLAEGLFEPLDERLESRLYDAIPWQCWERARYQDRLYYIPSEFIGDMRCHIWRKPDHGEDGLPEQFAGDLLKLGDYLSKDCQMFYDEEDFGFAEMFGYAFDVNGGVLIHADGTVGNPLDEEPVVDWLRSINRWYHEGKIQTNVLAKEQCSLVFSQDLQMRKLGYQEYAAWNGYVYHNFDYSTGILAGAEKKDDAYTLLELFHTDHSYGDLLIYGEEYLNKEPKGNSFMIAQLVYGLATGLKWGEDDIMPYFANSEEKKQYYDEYFLPSPCIYREFPEEGQTLLQAERRCLKRLITCGDFEAELQKVRDELEEPMNAVLRKLAESP